MELHQPKFSVIIAAYNAAATIGRAIESVLNQALAPWEVIVVDDGSTDETASEVRGYGSSVRYCLQSNQGVAAARNAGARLATGNWLAFLDADDVYHPNRLQDHRDLLSRFPDVDFMTGDTEFRTPDGEIIKRFIESVPIGQKVLARAGKEFLQTIEGEEIGAFVAAHFGNTNTLSVPRETFLTLGGYPIEYHVCEDVAFLIRLCARSHRIGVVCRPLATYFIYPNSATRRHPLDSQIQTVNALTTLANELTTVPPSVKFGLAERIRQARLGLAYVALRQRRRKLALTAVWPLALKGGFRGIRDFASVCKGVVGKGPC